MGSVELAPRRAGLEPRRAAGEAALLTQSKPSTIFCHRATGTGNVPGVSARGGRHAARENGTGGHSGTVGRPGRVRRVGRERGRGQASETPPTAQPGLDNPQVEPTPAQAAPDAPQVEPAAEATASGDVAASAGDAIDVAEHLRQKTMRMWEAYNTHDLNELKPFYEGNYWKEEEEELRSNMRPFKTFGISIKAEETSPPTEIAPGRWEISTSDASQWVR